MKTPVFIFLAAISLFSCKKEKIERIEVPVTHSWLLDSSLFGYNKFLVNSFPLNDSVLAVANRTNIWYVNANKLNQSIDGLFIPGITNLYSNFFAPSMTAAISAAIVDPGKLNIFTTINPASPFGIASFSPEYSASASSLKGLPFPSSVFNSGYPIIRSKYILAPTEVDFQAKKAYASIIKVDTTPVFPGQPGVKVAASNNLVLDPAPSTLGFNDGGYFSASYFDKFFLTYYNQFYRIDTLGNIKAFGYSPIGGQAAPVLNMFRLNNYLFALGNGKFFVSQDEGETWSLFLDASTSLYGGLNYINVGNNLYGIRNAQLWKVTMTGNTLTFSELDNDGLETNQITSINKTGKYVFVTTLSGLFYRDSTTFNTLKQ